MRDAPAFILGLLWGIVLGGLVTWLWLMPDYYEDRYTPTTVTITVDAARFNLMVERTDSLMDAHSWAWPKRGK